MTKRSRADQLALQAFLAGARIESDASHASVLIHIGDETRAATWRRRRRAFEKWWQKQRSRKTS